MKVRWGICSAGNSSNNFVSALSSLPSEDHTVVAISARSKEKAKAFAEKHQIAVAYEGYEALARDTNVDIVYVGSINPTHLPICKLFLNHSKNILCEKPLGLNKREVQEMIDLAKKKNVFFMEAWWSRFFPAIVKLQELFAANHIGEIKMVNGTLGLSMVQKERLYLKEYGGGGLLDIGVYLYQMALLVFGTTPLSSSTKGFLTDSGVDETTVTTMLFPNKAMASLTCSISQFLANDMEIRGTHGHIKIKSPFWCPTQLEVTTKETTEVLNFPLPKTSATLHFEQLAGLQYEAEAVRQCLIKGLKECPVIRHDESVMVAELLQNARHDVGYLLDADMEKGPMTCQ